MNINLKPISNFVNRVKAGYSKAWSNWASSPRYKAAQKKLKDLGYAP